MNRDTLRLSAAFALVFGVCYCGAAWLASRYGTIPAWRLPFEEHVPFVPSMAVVYLTIVPALFAAPFVFRTRDELAPLTASLIVETLIATLFFVVFPQQSEFARPPDNGAIFTFANWLNLDYNEFPSLHVAFAWTVAWAYAKRRNSPRDDTGNRVAWNLWALAVTLSAWLTWEHHFVDLAGGFVLAFIVTRPVVKLEANLILQCLRFSIRHPRYFVIFLAIWIPSLLRWRERRVVRLAFVVAQWIDDILDGDRRTQREPLEIVDDLLAGGATDSLAIAAAALFKELARFEGATDDFIALVKEMRIDRERVLSSARWSAAALDEHHRRTFHLSVELLLKLTGCRARASEIPALLDALAWCSTFRDLDDDLRKGLNNIPAEVTDVESWTRERYAQALRTLEASSDQLAALDDPQARKLLGVFQRSIERFAQRTRMSPTETGAYT